MPSDFRQINIQFGLEIYYIIIVEYNVIKENIRGRALISKRPTLNSVRDSSHFLPLGMTPSVVISKVLFNVHYIVMAGRTGNPAQCSLAG